MNHYSADGHARIDLGLLRGPWARQVGAYGIAVYNILVSFADNDTHQAWPSHQTIADLLGCSRRTVINSIAKLEQFNLIHRCRRRDERGWHSNMYTLLPPEQWHRPGESQGAGPALPAAGETPPAGELAARPEAVQAPATGASPAPDGACQTPDRARGSLTPGASAAHELDSLFLTNNSPCSNEHGPGPPVNGSQKQKRRRAKTKDPPLETYRQVTGRYPPRASEPLILAAGITSRADLEFWQEVIRHWIACGWSPQNLIGMLDHYREGRLPTTRPAGGYRSQRGKGAHHEPNGNNGTGGYRFATPADFGLPEDGDDSDDPEQIE